MSFAPQLLNDGDKFWHIAAGMRMIDSGKILFADPFSYTFAGAPGQTHEWLAEIVTAFAWRAVGWGGGNMIFQGVRSFVDSRAE